MNPLQPETPQQPPQNPASVPATGAWQEPTPAQAQTQTPLQPAQNMPQAYPSPTTPEPAPNYQEPATEQTAPPTLNQFDSATTPPVVSPITFASMTPELPTPPPSTRKKLMLFGVTFLVLIGAGFTSYLIITRGQANNSAANLEQSDPNATTITEDALNVLDDANTAEDTTTSDAKTSPTNPTSGSSSSTANTESTKKSSSGSQSTDNTKSSKSTTTTTKAVTVSCNKDTVSQKTVNSSNLQQYNASVNAAVAGKSSSLTSWLPAQYRYNDKDSQAGAVDASYKGLQPVSCTAFPVVIRKKNSFSQQGATLIVRFKDNKSKKSYISSINVSLVGSQWKTDRITAAKTN